MHLSTEKNVCRLSAVCVRACAQPDTDRYDLWISYGKIMPSQLLIRQKQQYFDDDRVVQKRFPAGCQSLGNPDAAKRTAAVLFVRDVRIPFGVYKVYRLLRVTDTRRLRAARVLFWIHLYGYRPACHTGQREIQNIYSFISFLKFWLTGCFVCDSFRDIFR